MNYRIRTILIFERFMNLYRTYSSNSRYTNLKHILLTGTDDSNLNSFLKIFSLKKAILVFQKNFEKIVFCKDYAFLLSICEKQI